MNDLFGSIFGLFQNIYGIPLSNFMYEDGRLYSQIGMAMVVVSIDFVFYKTQKCELFSLSPHKIKK